MNKLQFDCSNFQFIESDEIKVSNIRSNFVSLPLGMVQTYKI